MMIKRRLLCLLLIFTLLLILVFVKINVIDQRKTEDFAWSTLLEVYDGLTCPPVNWSNPRFCSNNSNLTLFGDRFDISPNLLQFLTIPLNSFVPLSAINKTNFVFVTATDKNYLHISMDAIGIVQRLFPSHDIYFYDLSRGKFDQQWMSLKIERLCNVKYRVLNFSRYPEHVRELKTYAFKPIIVHEMLREFDGVFWIDSSVRFLTNNLTSVFNQAYRNNGILAFARSHHSNFAATHPGMYRYLPISAPLAGVTEMRDANSILFFRTKLVYTKIVAWWVLCALKEDCIASGRGLLACHFKGKFAWAGCHRFDQSAINILMALHFQYDDQRYLSRETVLVVQRGSAHQELIEMCPNKTKIKSAEYFI